MSTLTQKKVRSTRTKTADDDLKSQLKLGKVVITPLPRRNDDIYMRTVRRPRA